MSNVDEKELYFSFDLSTKISIFTGLLGIIALCSKDFFELPWLELVSYACFTVAVLSIVLSIFIYIFRLIGEFPILIKGTILFTLIGLLFLVAAGIFVFDFLEYLYIGSFSLAGLLFILEIIYWTFGKVSGLSFFIRVIIFSAIVGTILLGLNTAFPIPELKTAYLIVYGTGVISLICELFKIIFLKI